MCISKKTGERARTLVTTSNTTAQFVPFTDWMPATGLDTVKCTWGQHGTSNFEMRAASQLAAVRPSNPDAWTASSASYQSGDGWFTDELDGSVVNDDHAWVRFGAQYRAVASGIGQADIRFCAYYSSVGKVVGHTGEFQVWAKELDTDPRYYPITDWIPAGGIVKAKAGYVYTGVEGTPEMTIVYRTASTDPEEPDGTWHTLPGADIWASATSNGERLIDDTDISGDLTEKMYVQFALGVRSASTAGTNCRATIKAHVACRS